MLWDLVYKATSFSQSGVSVGVENFCPRRFHSMKHAFVTVPTTDRKKEIKPKSVAVARLKDLSGRNYWGKPTVSGVALSLGEIFASAQIGPEEGQGVRDSLGRGLKGLKAQYAYFGL
jgi:hypothetical protein